MNHTLEGGNSDMPSWAKEATKCKTGREKRGREITLNATTLCKRANSGAARRNPNLSGRLRNRLARLADVFPCASDRIGATGRRDTGQHQK